MECSSRGIKTPTESVMVCAPSCIEMSKHSSILQQRLKSELFFPWMYEFTTTEGFTETAMIQRTQFSSKEHRAKMKFYLDFNNGSSVYYRLQSD